MSTGGRAGAPVDGRRASPWTCPVCWALASRRIAPPLLVGVFEPRAGVFGEGWASSSALESGPARASHPPGSHTLQRRPRAGPVLEWEHAGTLAGGEEGGHRPEPTGPTAGSQRPLRRKGPHGHLDLPTGGGMLQATLCGPMAASLPPARGQLAQPPQFQRSTPISTGREHEERQQGHGHRKPLTSALPSTGPGPCRRPTQFCARPGG